METTGFQAYVGLIGFRVVSRDRRNVAQEHEIQWISSVSKRVYLEGSVTFFFLVAEKIQQLL